ncbi:hypothetical protein [Leptolyngbya sp. 7M]|nr:hypothetical protein [Leptolyngbya sp. 7M]QYO65363.1 hypothetical protein JVX88_00845 [Leptolyngbya sp. 7M]
MIDKLQKAARERDRRVIYVQADPPVESAVRSCESRGMGEDQLRFDIEP